MNQSTPEISVLMTTYNREDYLSVAIESVLSSTFKDFELIIVDDGSKDQTVSIAKGYAMKDDRVKVFVNEKNLGDYPNRNKAASLAKGRYLKYVDADDYMYPWALEVLFKSMESFPEAGWGLCSLDQNNQQPYPFCLKTDEIFTYHNFKSSLFHKAPLSSIIKKDIFEQVGGFSGKRQMGDTEMWHILSLRYPVVLMPHGMVWYRVHDAQESAQIRNELIVRLRYTISILHFYEMEKSIPMSDSDKQRVIRKLRMQLKNVVLRKILRFQFSMALSILSAWKSHEYDFKTID
jgi:glycosyltransferase involved in cell wall biosynthesis